MHQRVPSRSGFMMEKMEKEMKHMSFDEREEDSRGIYEGKSGGRMLFDDAMMDDEEEDIICYGTGGTAEDNEFDEIVGHLEEIIMDMQFVNLQNSFCKKYCHIFEDTAENKLEYTGIFNEYTDTIEAYLENRLKKLIPSFRLDRFARMCEERKDEITGDVFDILLSCGDFREFKFLMLSHKNSRNFSAPAFGL